MLKFDIIVFGVSILVVWMGYVGLMGLMNFDIRVVNFNIILGILMLCLYVSGLGVLLKFVYFDWSFVVIKFVMMIMVSLVDNMGWMVIDVVMGLMGIFWEFGFGYVMF